MNIHIASNKGVNIMCKELIQRHIQQLPNNEMFTTREMLAYGSRKTVDSALARMVEMGFIFRLARGVFIRDVTRLPSAFEIAQVKTGNFGSGAEIIKELAVPDEPGNSNVFAILGSSTKFWTVQGIVHLKSTCARKFVMPEFRSRTGS
jgi:hypothetical protein